MDCRKKYDSAGAVNGVFCKSGRRWLLDGALLFFFLAFVSLFCACCPVQELDVNHVETALIEDANAIVPVEAEEVPDNRICDEMLLRRFPFARNDLRRSAERRFSSGAASLRHQLHIALLARVPESLREPEYGSVAGDDSRHFLLAVCLRAATPVRAGPFCRFAA